MGLSENADFYRRVGELLTAWGWDDFLNWWPGWDTRTNSSTIRTPIGVTVHHTGGVATATSYLVNPTDRPQLKVLANIHIDTLERRIRFVCAGGASHGGFTHKACFDRIIKGTAPLDRDLVPGPDSTDFSINRVTVGIEVDGAGGVDEWDDWTHRAAVAASAACQIAGGWLVAEAPRVGAHKEHTTRKPGDPFVNMGAFRTDVLDCLNTPWAPSVGRPDFVLGDRTLSLGGNDSGSDVADLVRLLIALGHDLQPGEEFTAEVDLAVRDFQARHGVIPDGVVRLDTVEELRRALTAPGSNDIEIPDGEAAGDLDPPPQTEAPATERKFRFGQANLQAERFGGLVNESPRRGEFLRDVMKCSVYALCEVPEQARDAIRAVLGETRYRVFPIGFVCVLWDSTKWQHAGKKTVDFGTPIHGAVRVTLEDVEGSGLSMDVISVHVRPGVSIGGSAADKVAGKQKDIRKAMGLIRKGVPTIVAGDFNTSTAFDVIKPFGFARLTRHVDTLNAVGIQRVDGVFATAGVQLRDKSLMDPGAVSDHQAWMVKATLRQA